MSVLLQDARDAYDATWQEPYSLEAIKISLICKGVTNHFFQPLRSFFQKMVLSWGDAPTACARKRGGIPHIELGRKFFAEEVRDEGEAAEVVLHEIMHHLFGHLYQARQWLSMGYSDDTIGKATDAIINAYLHNVSCAGFMERYYPDSGVTAYLRPNSRNTMVKERPQPQTPATETRRDENGSTSQPSLTAGGVFEGSLSNFMKAVRKALGVEGDEFYSSLYSLCASLEHSLEFFHEHFADEEGNVVFLGSHDRLNADTEEEPGSDSGLKRPRQKHPGMNAHDRETPEGAWPAADGLFTQEEAENILREFGTEYKISSEKKSNFAQVIRSIRKFAQKPGKHKHGTRKSRRMPSKLKTGDLVGIERGSEFFRRADHKGKQIAIFLDVSGSMDRYIPFVKGLVRSLAGDGHTIDCYYFAERVQAVQLSCLKADHESNVGIGTSAEAVAVFLAESRISEAVVVTDNCAGAIKTEISIPLQVCLLPYSTETGSFLDHEKVPGARVHHLVYDETLSD